MYILFDDKTVYVGEAKSLYARLKTHMTTPEEKIQNWRKAILISDGRPAPLSEFGESVIRKSLELFLIELFKANKYRVVSQGESQAPTAQQRVAIDDLQREIVFDLKKKNVITKELEEWGQQEVFDDDLRKIVSGKGKRIESWTKKQAVIDGDPVFIRPGSKKPRGWQITFRGRKPGSFIDCLQRGIGYLLVPRDGVLYIPLREVQKVIADPVAYEQDTIDIWVVFIEGRVLLRYKEHEIDITQFKMIP